MMDNIIEFFQQLGEEVISYRLTDAERDFLASQEVTHNYDTIFKYSPAGVVTRCHLCEFFALWHPAAAILNAADKGALANNRLEAIIAHIKDNHVTANWLKRKYA